KLALEHWEKAAAADHDTVNTVRALHLKGSIYQEMGQLKDAEEAYEKALLVNHESELALDSLVRLELAANDRPRALESLRRYAVAVGDEPAGLLLAAGHYLRLRLYEEARELADRAGEEHYPGKVQRILGLVHFHRGDAAGAVQHLTQAEPGTDVLEAL